MFNGANVNENIDISANGSRARLTRDVGNVTMDLNGIEHIQLATLGGADTVTVDDLTGTDVKQVAIDLSATPGSGQGDGQPDTVIVNGTDGDDNISVVSSGSSVRRQWTGGAGDDQRYRRRRSISSSSTAWPEDDIINASALHAGQINLTLNGGDGNDIITGSAGNDIVIGGRGNDTALLGAGDDTFVWNPGDGSDVVDGQARNRHAAVQRRQRQREHRHLGQWQPGAGSSATSATSPWISTASRHIDVKALGGADTITVNDLTGTGVNQVAIDLSAAPGSGTGDGQADTVVINATNGDDVINITENNGVVTVSGLATDVTISGFDTNDRLVINGLGGDDVINASGLPGRSCSPPMAATAMTS